MMRTKYNCSTKSNVQWILAVFSTLKDRCQAYVRWELKPWISRWFLDDGSCIMPGPENILGKNIWLVHGKRHPKVAICSTDSA